MILIQREDFIKNPRACFGPRFLIPNIFLDEQPGFIKMIDIPGNGKIKDFSIGKYPVTQFQYQVVMGKNPSYFKGLDRPVECVSWYDAQEFIKRLNQHTGLKYRLPTATEWEYACRAGTTTEYYWGDNENEYNDYAWCYQNSKGETHDVGLKKPNAWGLYDMSGNVWEWCDDLEDKEGGYSVIRGGSWEYDSGYVRSANRNWSHPLSTWSTLGFRIVAMRP